MEWGTPAAMGARVQAKRVVWGMEKWGELQEFVVSTGRVITLELQGHFQNEDLRKWRKAPHGWLSTSDFNML